VAKTDRGRHDTQDEEGLDDNDDDDENQLPDRLAASGGHGP
jgi:hypothetical protein